MPAIDLTDVAGLVTAPGLLQRNPASCTDTLNWEFPAPGLIRKRRGFLRNNGNAGGPVWKLLTSRLMGNNLLAHIGTGSAGTQLRYGDGSVALSTLATVDGASLDRPQGTRMAMALCQRNHYCTATYGAARVESDISVSLVRYAGMPRGLGLFNGWSTAPGTFFASGSARAYRITWHRKDADGVELGGAPSARWVCSNTAGAGGFTGAAKAMGMFPQVPKEFGTLATPLNTSYYYRIWGTRQYTIASQLGDDECYLLTEQYLTAADIANGFITFVDDTPDSFLLTAPTLHTNLSNFPPSEVGIRQGIVNEDAPPPIANDVAYWQDCMWWADIVYRPTLTVGMIAQLADGEQVFIFINGTFLGTLTAKNVPFAPTDFQIGAGFATLAENMRETAAALAACINLNFGAQGVDAYHVSTSTTAPAVLMLECRKPNATANIGFTSTAPTKWQGYDGFNILSSTAQPEPQTNTLVFSKPLRADAVPIINQLTAGPADSRILRIFPFRDRMLVFTDYGIFQVTGRSYADFSVFPFDLGYRLMGRELVALCDEKVYAWCYEGIIEIDDGGVTVISTPIEPTIDNALWQAGGGVVPVGRSSFAELGFATAYRNQHQVRFHYPETVPSSDMHGSALWLSFDTRTRKWSQGQFSVSKVGSYLDFRTCAVVRFSDDLLTCGAWSSGADTRLFTERNKFDPADYTDTLSDGTATAVFSRLRTQYQVPDDSGAQHWQQSVLNWDGGEWFWRTLPTSFTITHDADGVSVSSSVSVSASATRVETPMPLRRARQLAVTITHSIQEYAGLTGVSQTLRDGGTKFGRKVTP